MKFFAVRPRALMCVFIVDDVAFIQDRCGYAIGAAIEASSIKKQYYLETRGDVFAAEQGCVPLLAQTGP
jgi:hypothetical protein